MKSVLVYYSLSGNTDWVAKKISESIKCDLIRLKPLKEYPSSGFRKFFWGGKSAVMKEIPELSKYDFNYSKYDQIIFGTPVWASNYNPTLRTFIKDNKDKLKKMKISVFVCCSGGNANKTIDKLKNDIGIDNFDNQLVLIDPLDKPTKEKSILLEEFIKKVG